MILAPEVLTLTLLNFLFLIFATIAFYIAIKIFLNWDTNATTKLQYKLEKGSYLSATIIKFILAIKIPLFLFFIFVLDNSSTIIHGAMCGAGVIDATDYGAYLLIVKILNIYLFAFWIVLNRVDTTQEEQPYIKQKFGLFIFIYLLFVLEVVLEFIMFNAIDVTSIVDCCGVIYSSSDSSYLSSLLNAESFYLVSGFYLLYSLILISYLMKKRYLFAIFNLLFLIMALISLITFFGTYIYELPSHRCPFCYLQKDYNYVGYILYIFLFIGTFSGLVIGLINNKKMNFQIAFRYSILFNTLYVLVVTYYPVAFYIKNGVWL